MIDKFDGEFRWLSNFSPHPVRWNSTLTFPTVEHGFVFFKTRDPRMRELILECPTPGKVKRMGRNLELREDWEDIKVHIMHQLVFRKFTQHKDLRRLLIHTGDQPLIEGNHWGDTFWGVCNGVGQNMLGIILMDVRNHLRRL
jgi:N-glycosidase YbiA